jgi:glyoxylase-like metal-dependent hydrolase (beta-lactamase superfamily II)
MAAEVKILVVGETNAGEVVETNEERTRPTITLIREGDLNIIVDPGILESQQILIDALASEGLVAEDINIVCITHSHIDHYRNVGMFPKAKILEHYGLWNKEFVEDWPEHFSPHIRVIRTPGHDYTGITLLVTTEDGVVAICGDVFWKENYPKDPKDDIYASDTEKLAKSRKLILEMADFIIPGHAGMYEVKKGFVQKIKNNIVAGPNKQKLTLYCKKCKKMIESAKDCCACRPWLGYECCGCEMDCKFCSCSHKKFRH